MNSLYRVLIVAHFLIFHVDVPEAGLQLHPAECFGSDVYPVLSCHSGCEFVPRCRVQAQLFVEPSFSPQSPVRTACHAITPSGSPGGNENWTGFPIGHRVSQNSRKSFSDRNAANVASSPHVLVVAEHDHLSLLVVILDVGYPEFTWPRPRISQRLEKQPERTAGEFQNCRLFRTAWNTISDLFDRDAKVQRHGLFKVPPADREASENLSSADAGPDRGWRRGTLPPLGKRDVLNELGQQFMVKSPGRQLSVFDRERLEKRFVRLCRFWGVNRCSVINEFTDNLCNRGHWRSPGCRCKFQNYNYYTVDANGLSIYMELV